jgi:hypothetical protein
MGTPIVILDVPKVLPPAGLFKAASIEIAAIAGHAGRRL